MEYKIKRCAKCGALIMALKDCNCANCNIVCCDEPMKESIANSVDAAFEKHVPTYELKNDEVIARVNHVMETDHYIEWISFVSDKNVSTTYFEPGEEPKASAKYVKGMQIYAYCNKHELWFCEVK